MSNKMGKVEKGSKDKREKRGSFAETLKKGGKVISRRGSALRRRSSGALTFFKDKLKSIRSDHADDDGASSFSTGSHKSSKSSKSSKSKSTSKSTQRKGSRSGKSNPQNGEFTTDVMERRIQRRKELRERRKTETGMTPYQPHSRKASMCSVSSSGSRGHTSTEVGGSFHVASHARMALHSRTLSSKTEKVKSVYEDEDEDTDDEEFLEEQRQYLQKRDSMAAKSLYY